MYKRENIDFAYLVGDGTRDGLKYAVEQALSFRPRGLCVNPVVNDYLLRDDDTFSLFDQLPMADVLRQFVIDFPFGQGGHIGKLLVAEELVSEGIVDEFDVVANIGSIIGSDKKKFSDELSGLIRLQKPVKVIVETGYYADRLDILERIVHWCAEVKAFAIKTSTGFIKNIDNKTKLEHVALWREIINREGYGLKIKDAGGKTSREDIDNSIAAGANIIGSSSVIM